MNRGNVEAALAQGSKTFEATYLWPFQNHGMMGPSCAVADVQGDKATVWAGSQGTFSTRKQVADLLGIPEKNVRVIYRESSGCYGRLSPDDVPLDAALMSRAVGKPVRVQWMRDDEHGWEPKGPAQCMTVRAAVDASGKVTAWEFEDRSFPWTENRNPYLAAQQIGHKPTSPGIPNGTGGGGQIYNVEHQRVVAAPIPWLWPDPMPLRTSNLRAPGDLARSVCQRKRHRRDRIEPRRRSGGVSLALFDRAANHRRAQRRDQASEMGAAAVTGAAGERRDRDGPRRRRRRIAARP